MFGAKLSWCQIVRCQIVLVPNCPGAKLSTFIILVPNCPLLLSWCQIARFIILVPNCPVPNCPTIHIDHLDIHDNSDTDHPSALVAKVVQNNNLPKQIVWKDYMQKLWQKWSSTIICKTYLTWMTVCKICTQKTQQQFAKNVQNNNLKQFIARCYLHLW